MSPEIDHAIKQALEAVAVHPDYWLLPIHRRSLYHVLDPVKSVPTRSHVRAWLDLLTAQYVLTLWLPILQDPVLVWEQDAKLPALMVELTERVLLGSFDKIPIEELAAVWSEAAIITTKKPGQISIQEMAADWLEMSDLSGELPESQYYHAWCVFDAALMALHYALGNDFFAHASLTDTRTEITDRYSDTANLAVVAYAGGVWQADTTRDKEYDRFGGDWNLDLDEVRTRRRTFWEWWLLEAIPAAYEQANQHQ